MEGEELDELVNLIDHDSDDDFIDQLYGDNQEMSDNTATTNDHQDVSNMSNDTVAIEPSQDSQVSPENMSKRMTDMEKYIKFLEAQLKTKNEEKKKSPDSKSAKVNSPIEERQNTTVTKKFYSQPARENSQTKNSTSHKQPQKTSSPLNSSNDAFVRKPRVAHKPRTSESSHTEKGQTERRNSGLKRKAEEPAPNTSSAKKTAQETFSGVTEGYSGLRIVNPLISSTVMERRMDGRKIIKVSSIQSRIRNNDIEGDWVTIGVLIQKLPKTTAKGEAYSIWKLSDLAFHLQNSIVSVFLFGENHKEHWKTVEGSVVALLNPAVLPPREKQSSDVAINLDNPKKLMMIGTSQDFGVCQSGRKSDGKRCSNFINKAQGNYCQYHVQREYSKKRSKRMECQQGYGAPSKLPGSNLKQKIAGESFFYGGKIVSSSPAAAPRKEKVTLKSLAPSSSGGKDYLNAWKEKQSVKPASGKSSSNKEGPSEDFISLLNVPTVGSRNLKLHLHKEDEKEKEVNEPKPVLSASEFLKANNIQRTKERQSTSSVFKAQRKAEATTSKDSPTPNTPVLGRGLSFDDDVVFDENVPSNFVTRSSSSNPDKAKKLALAIVRQTGPITPKDPNDVRVKKPSPKLQDVIKSKLESDDESGW